MENENLDGLLEGLPDKPVTPSKTTKRPVKVDPETGEEAPKRGRKAGSIIETPLVSYTGRLQVFTLNEFKFPDGYDETILTFKEFLEQLGREGVTFEQLFEAADKAYQNGVLEAEVSKLKQKFAAINNRNTLTLKTIDLICSLLGYKTIISFERASVDTLNLEVTQDLGE